MLTAVATALAWGVTVSITSQAAVSRLFHSMAATADCRARWPGSIRATRRRTSACTWWRCCRWESAGPSSTHRTCSPLVNFGALTGFCLLHLSVINHYYAASAPASGCGIYCSCWWAWRSSPTCCSRASTHSCSDWPGSRVGFGSTGVKRNRWESQAPTELAKDASRGLLQAGSSLADEIAAAEAMPQHLFVECPARQLQQPITALISPRHWPSAWRRHSASKASMLPPAPEVRPPLSASPRSRPRTWRSAALASSRTLPGQSGPSRQFRWRGGLRLAAEALAGNAGEMFEEQQDVLATLADRRQAQLGDVQAIHQVLAEASGTCFGQQVGLVAAITRRSSVDTLVRASRSSCCSPGRAAA